MGEILAIVLPVFGLIGIGAAFAWTKLLSHASGDALSEFVFVVAIPLLIFRIVATADFSGLSAWRLWLAFFAAFAVSWAAGTILIRRLFGRDAHAGLVAGLAAGYGNTTLIGIPLALAAFGVDGSVPMALIIAVQLPIMMAVGGALMVRAERQARDVVHDLGLGSVTRWWVRRHRGRRGRGVEVGAAKPEHLQGQPEILAGLPDPFHPIAADGRRGTRVPRPDHREDLVDVVAERPAREGAGGLTGVAVTPHLRMQLPADLEVLPPRRQRQQDRPTQQPPIVAPVDGPAARRRGQSGRLRRPTAATATASRPGRGRDPSRGSASARRRDARRCPAPRRRPRPATAARPTGR